MRVVGDAVEYECHRCGETDVDPDGHDCGGELPFDGDRCPMCGEVYDGFLSHLSNCEP